MPTVARNTDTLFFDITSDNLKVSYNTTNLFFEVKDFDASFPIYKVLLDFIESMSLGDVAT